MNPVIEVLIFSTRDKEDHWPIKELCKISNDLYKQTEMIF